MKAIIITASVFLAMFIGTLGYVIGLSQGLSIQQDKIFKYAGYESDDTHYTNGQILLPDMLHDDTLIVTNAPYLNECLARPEVGSDGDIMEILNETTVKYFPTLPIPAGKYPMTAPEPTIILIQPNTITKQETDERGLTSVQYIQDGHEWGLDYLTKHEYDSAFHDYVNYKKIEDNR